ncbi:STAS domain-containing protein [candidate division KSB1 bacterium]|nr:STAS domain-containing protein [candidate division KSB1 bacterium]
MTIETKEQAGTLIIYPKVKHLDSSVSMDFREKIKAYIDKGHTKMIINLNDVDFIDSSGLGALVLGHKEMRKRGSLVIVSAKPTINNMLKLVRLDQVLNIFENETDALTNLNG